MEKGAYLAVQGGDRGNKVCSLLWNHRESLDPRTKALYYTPTNEESTQQSIAKCILLDVPSRIANARTIFSVDRSDDAKGAGDMFDSIQQIQRTKPAHSTPVAWHYPPSVLSDRCFIAYGGGGSDSFSVDHTAEEEVRDTLRYFAETCDRVESIDFILDSSFLSSHSSSILQATRDDFGRSVAIPVWWITNKALLDSDEEQPPFIPSMGQKFFYADALDVSNIVIPICPPASLFSHHFKLSDPSGPLLSSFAMAAAIETCLSYRSQNTMSSRLMDSMEWIECCTAGGRFPVCSLEAQLPDLTHDSAVCTADAILDTLATSTVSSSCANVESDRVNIRCRNPFMTSFSPLNYAPKQYSSPLTSYLAIQGQSVLPDLQERLFMHCVGSNYRMSGCVLSPDEHFFCENPKSQAVLMSASIGAGEDVGHYIQQEAQELRRLVRAGLGAKISSVFDKEVDEMEECVQRLLNLADNYHVSSSEDWD